MEIILLSLSLFVLCLFFCIFKKKDENDYLKKRLLKFTQQSFQLYQSKYKNVVELPEKATEPLRDSYNNVIYIVKNSCNKSKNGQTTRKKMFSKFSKKNSLNY